MEGVIDSTDSYIDILAYLKQCYDKLKDTVALPVPMLKLENIYREFVSKEVTPVLAEKCPHLASLKQERINMLLEHHILNELKFKNWTKLSEFMNNEMDNFLKNFDFFMSFENPHIESFIEEQIDENDSILSLLQVEDMGKSKVKNKKPELKGLNNRLQGVYNILMLYQKLMYCRKYEMIDLYYSREDDIKEDTMERIYKIASIRHEKTVKMVKGKIEKAYERLSVISRSISKVVWMSACKQLKT